MKEKDLIENEEEAKKVDEMVLGEIAGKSIGLLGFVGGIILLGLGIGTIFIGYWAYGAIAVVIGLGLMFFAKR